MTLGCLAAAANTGKTAENHRIRMRMRRIKGRSLHCSRLLFWNKVSSRRSENDLGSDLRSARAALREERVAGGDIGRLRVFGEVRLRAEVGNLALRDRAAARKRIEVRMVQQVEDLKADLEAHPFGDLGSLDEVKIPLPEVGSAESVAAAGADGVVGRNREYRGHIRNGGRAGVAELVNGLYSRTVRPLVNLVLAGTICGAAQQRGPGAAGQSRYDRTNLPTLSQASCGAPVGKIVDHAGIKVQPDIRVARAQVAAGIVRILRDRNGRRTASIHGIGVNTVRPGEVNQGVEPMPFALAVSYLHRVVAGVAIVGQLHDVLEIGRSIQLVHRVKRARTIPSCLLHTTHDAANGAVIQAALQQTICSVGTHITHGDCVVSEQLVLNRGVVILDSWRFQIRNSSEYVKRRCASGIGAIGLERQGWVRTSRLRTDASEGRGSARGIGCRVVARVRPKRLEQDWKARILSPLCVDREDAQVRVCKGASSGILERVRCADSGKIGHVVSHGITKSESGLAVAEDVPSQPGAWAKVLKVQVIETREPLLYLNQAVRKAWRRADRWLRRGAGEEIRGILVGVTQRTIDVPTQAVADGQARSEFPVVLEKQSHR